MADGDLDKIEAGVVEAVAGKWAGQVEAFRKALLAAHSTGTLTPARVRALAARLDTSPATVNAARALLPAAVVGDARVKVKTAVVLPSPATAAIITKAQKKPAEAKAAMLKRAVGLDLTSISGVLGVLGPLGSSVNAMNGAASYAVQSAANAAVIGAAAQDETDVVFVPERDACVECNERAGQTGEQVTDDPPPVHPHCRCEVEPYVDPAVPRALQREAVRSALRGFSLPSESAAERLRYAKKVLARQPVAPASVKAYAAASLKRGEFARGRAVP